MSKASTTPFIERPNFRYGDGTEVVVIHTEMPDQRALLASELIARWGRVSAKPQGEDSAGRQAAALHTPAEVVARACEMAELAWTAFGSHGWLVKIPVPKVGKL